MRPRTRVQLTTYLCLATTSAWALPSELALGDPRPGLTLGDASLDWRRAVLELLGILEKYLECQTARTEDVVAMLQQSIDCYYANGLPSGDPEVGRDLVEQTYSLLLADPGVLTPTQRTRFLLDLTQMYIALGGNPLELGAVGAGQ